jgi:hypothetical protein
MIDFTCGRCGRRYSVEAALQGKRAKCPCGNQIIIAALPVEEARTPKAAGGDRVPEATMEAVPVPGEPLYIEADDYIDAAESADKFVATHRTYCEKCKRPHRGFQCPSCGRAIGNGAFGGCIYCRTAYRAGRTNCPVCEVQRNLDKANTPETPPNKALEHWEAAYGEARSNGDYFSINEHIIHVRCFVHAARGKEAWGTAARIFDCCTERFSLSRGGPQEQAKFYSQLSQVEDAMAYVMMMEEQHYRSEHGQQDLPQAVAYVVHAILSLLYYRAELKINTQLMPDIYGKLSADAEGLEKISVKRMKRVLIDIKKNKQGRPEALCQDIKKHIASIPRIDPQAVQQDVAAVLARW